MTTPEQTPLREDALAFLKKHTIGTLATVSADGTPRARTMYFASDDSFAIYIASQANTRKWDDLQQDGHAAFVVANETVPQTLQIEGTITDLTDATPTDPALANLTEVLVSNKNYFAPLTHFDPGKMLFLKLTPTWVRWGDFSKGHGTAEVMHEIEL